LGFALPALWNGKALFNWSSLTAYGGFLIENGSAEGLSLNLSNNDFKKDFVFLSIMMLFAKGKSSLMRIPF